MCANEVLCTIVFANYYCLCLCSFHSSTLGLAYSFPTVTFATDAVKLGVKGAFITDGRVPHALLNEVLAGGEKGMGSGGGGTIVTL